MTTMHTMQQGGGTVAVTCSVKCRHGRIAVVKGNEACSPFDRPEVVRIREQSERWYPPSAARRPMREERSMIWSGAQSDSGVLPRRCRLVF